MRQRQLDTWIGYDAKDPSWEIRRDGAARPRTEADARAWRRAGSPRRRHLNEQGITTVPIEGDDLVTDSQAASAVKLGDDARVLYSGDWWATVREVRPLGRVSDPLGRPGTGVARTEHRSDGAIVDRRLIIGPRTGLLLADQEIAVKPSSDRAWEVPGSQSDYSARLDADWTDADPEMPSVDCAAASPPSACR